MIVFDRMKKLCKEQNISINDLEESLNYSKNTLYRLKSQTPGTDKLAAIADYFNVSTDYLLGRTDKKRYLDFSEKDEPPIQKELKKLFDHEDINSAFAVFNGAILEKLNEEDKKMLLATWENTLRLTRHMAKLNITSK